ncbi:cupin domain-containing protein [Sedimenticola selenatireducens]|uniref:cupin domain-containing protein n=1 Tax=Sedimenticola selenatireducens TaxID=191960 RepID=UPI00048D9372|nr:cupin domain-containing protein [Sedimenticola selenatireducens]
MSRTPLIVNQNNYGPALNVVGTKVTVLASNKDTKGQEFSFQSGENNMGPPPHSHDWDEAFFVLKGSVEFTCDGKADMCTPGTLVFIPGGTIHAFKYGPDGGEMLEVTGAGSIASQMFTAVDKQIPADSQDVEKIIEVVSENGVTVHL